MKAKWIAVAVPLMAAAALGWVGTGSASQAAAPPASLPTAAAEGRPVAATPAPREAVPADATLALRAQIERAVGSAACRDDSQCRALPLGSKPCGGPEGYLAWSTAATDGPALEALAARYKQAREARNQRLGLMSDCAVVPPPLVRCVAVAAGGSASGHCRAAAARSGPAAATR